MSNTENSSSADVEINMTPIAIAAERCVLNEVLNSEQPQIQFVFHVYCAAIYSAWIHHRHNTQGGVLASVVVDQLNKNNHPHLQLLYQFLEFELLPTIDAINPEAMDVCLSEVIQELLKQNGVTKQ